MRLSFFSLFWPFLSRPGRCLFHLKPLLFVLSSFALFFTFNTMLKNKDSQSSTPVLQPLHECGRNHNHSHKNYIEKTPLNFSEIRYRLEHWIYLQHGGRFLAKLNSVESACKSEPELFKNIALIVPYRDRLHSLQVFLSNMHRILARMNINYAVYVIEPVADIAFNRGLLMNIGFVESILDMLETSPARPFQLLRSNLSRIQETPSFWDCFIFHDVNASFHFFFLFFWIIKTCVL